MNNNPILTDDIFKAMTTVLAMYRRAEKFPDLLRSFWTTVCVINGVTPMIGADAYEEALDELCTVYAKAGVQIDREFMRVYLDRMDDEPDDDGDD